MMDKKDFRFYYGILLVAAGLGVFYRIPQVMSQIEIIEFFKHKMISVKVCSSFIGICLLSAGAIRIFKHFK